MTMHRSKIVADDLNRRSMANAQWSVATAKTEDSNYVRSVAGARLLFNQGKTVCGDESQRASLLALSSVFDRLLIHEPVSSLPCASPSGASSRSGSKRSLLDMNKVNHLLESLRTTEFAGKFDPNHHFKYLEPNTELPGYNSFKQAKQRGSFDSSLHATALYKKSFSCGCEQTHSTMPPLKKIKSHSDVQ